MVTPLVICGSFVLVVLVAAFMGSWALDRLFQVIGWLLIVAVCVLFGAGGGCLIGAYSAPRAKDWPVALQWAIDGGIIGAVAGLITALLVISQKSQRRGEDD